MTATAKKTYSMPGHFYRKSGLPEPTPSAFPENKSPLIDHFHLFNRSQIVTLVDPEGPTYQVVYAEEAILSAPEFRLLPPNMALRYLASNSSDANGKLPLLYDYVLHELSNNLEMKKTKLLFINWNLDAIPGTVTAGLMYISKGVEKIASERQAFGVKALEWARTKDAKILAMFAKYSK